MIRLPLHRRTSFGTEADCRSNAPGLLSLLLTKSDSKCYTQRRYFWGRVVFNPSDSDNFVCAIAALDDKRALYHFEWDFKHNPLGNRSGSSVAVEAMDYFENRIFICLYKKKDAALFKLFFQPDPSTI